MVTPESDARSSFDSSQRWTLSFTNPIHNHSPWRDFVGNYLNLVKTSGKPDANTVEGVLNEIKHYSLASHLFWSLWSFVNAKVSQIPFGYYEYAEERLNCYYELKGELVGGGKESKK